MQAYFFAAELLRVARAIVPLVVVQYAIKSDRVYPGQLFEVVVPPANMRADNGCFLLVEAARGVQNLLRHKSLAVIMKKPSQAGIEGFVFIQPQKLRSAARLPGLL